MKWDSLMFAKTLEKNRKTEGATDAELHQWAWVPSHRD